MADPGIPQKRCSVCTLVKPITEFYPRKGYALGRDYRCLTCKKEYDAERKRSPFMAQQAREYYAANKQMLKARQGQDRRSVKAQVLAAYGNTCACCGETEPDFLTIDHINGDGRDDRKRGTHRGQTSGDGFYRKLRKDGFPKDNYQLLCWNCNCAKGHYGQCPHVRRLEEISGNIGNGYHLFTDPARLIRRQNSIQ